jgi:conjugal transfer mating pair stabilization protein TraN
VKRFIVWFSCCALLLAQHHAFAGPHEEGIAAGQAANPVIKGSVNAPDASANVPGYTTTPAQSSLYKLPNLPAKANAQLMACTLTPNDPACEAQTTATRSANTPRPALGPFDPAVAAARGITRNPGTVLDNLPSYYSGCTTSTVSSGPGTVNRTCNRYTDIGAYACRKHLTVDVKLNANCEVGTWFAQAQADRNHRDHMYAQAQCRISGDGQQHFKFYAHGAVGACADWQAVSLPTAPLSEPTLAADLSPHWSGHCWSPFKVVAMPGSGCVNGQCNYSFQFGSPVYQCPAGSVAGDRLLIDSAGNPSGGSQPGSPDECYRVSQPAWSDEGSSCPAGMRPAFDIAMNAVCVGEAAPGKVIGASGWTLPLSYVEPKMVVAETDRWDNNCPPLDAAGRCTVASADRCVEGPASKLIGGAEVTRACWAYERTMSCTSATANDQCAPLVAAGCTASASVCVKTDLATGSCVQYQDTYQCPSPGETITTASNCPKDVFCVGTSCFSTAYTNDADFAKSMSYMEAAREAGTYLDTDKLTVFNGEDNRCRDRLLKNCCYSDGAGAGMTNQSVFGIGSTLVFDILTKSENRDFITAGLRALLMDGGFNGTFTTYGFTLAVNGAALPAGSTVLYSSSAVAGEGVVLAFDPWSLAIAVVIYVVMSMMSCNENEGQLALKQGASLCHEVGSYCSHKILGFCVTTTYSHCCFNSVLSRIINEQGRMQFAKAWGGAKTPDCSGFTIAQLQSLDFAAMDFSEFYASIVPKLPDLGALQGANTSRIPACYYGQGKC